MMALHELLGRGHEVTLLTTVTEDDRMSAHGVRREVLEAQARVLNLPLHIVTLPHRPTNEVYETKVREALQQLQAEGVTHAAFGDIFLEDLKAYRERLIAPLGLKSIFPLWGRDSRELMREFLARGFKAVTVCADGEVLTRAYIGRELDESFLRNLPKHLDPCGENGEFHTLVYGGPLFERGLELALDTITFDGRFYRCEVRETS